MMVFICSMVLASLRLESARDEKLLHRITSHGFEDAYIARQLVIFNAVRSVAITSPRLVSIMMYSPYSLRSVSPFKRTAFTSRSFALRWRLSAAAPSETSLAPAAVAGS